jgi:hypothetical protein
MARAISSRLRAETGSDSGNSKGSGRRRTLGPARNFVENRRLSPPTVRAAPPPHVPVFNFTFVPWFRVGGALHPQAYRNQTFVVGLAGEAIAAGKLHRTLAQDLALIQAMGMKLVLVHGFRPQVNEQLRPRGTPRYSHGMRITDAVALDCAQEAAGQLRYEIEAAFSQGLPNTPMANATVRVISGQLPHRAAGGHRRRRGLPAQRPGAQGRRGGHQRTLDMGALVLLSPFRLLAHRRGLQPDDGRRGHRGGHRAAGRQADLS